MAYYNGLGCLIMGVGIALGVGAWAIVDTLSDDTDVAEGVGALVAGIAIASFDLFQRHRHIEEGFRRYYDDNTGGTTGFPCWVFGVFLIVGGVAMISVGR